MLDFVKLISSCEDSSNTSLTFEFINRAVLFKTGSWTIHEIESILLKLSSTSTNEKTPEGYLFQSLIYMDLCRLGQNYSSNIRLAISILQEALTAYPEDFLNRLLYTIVLVASGIARRFAYFLTNRCHFYRFRSLQRSGYQTDSN